MRTDGIWANIFRLGRSKETLPDTLRRIPMFKDLGARELGTLGNLVHTRTYQTGEVVSMEKEPGAGMYVILSGGVEILLNHDIGRAIVSGTAGSWRFLRGDGPPGRRGTIGNRARQRGDQVKVTPGKAGGLFM